MEFGWKKGTLAVYNQVYNVSEQLSLGDWNERRDILDCGRCFAILYHFVCPSVCLHDCCLPVYVFNIFLSSAAFGVVCVVQLLLLPWVVQSPSFLLFVKNNEDAALKGDEIWILQISLVLKKKF